MFVVDNSLFRMVFRPSSRAHTLAPPGSHPVGPGPPDRTHSGHQHRARHPRPIDRQVVRRARLCVCVQPSVTYLKDESVKSVSPLPPPCSLARHSNPIAPSGSGAREVQTLRPTSLSSGQPLVVHAGRSLTPVYTEKTYSSIFFNLLSKSQFKKKKSKKQAFSVVISSGGSNNVTLSCTF